MIWAVASSLRPLIREYVGGELVAEAVPGLGRCGILDDQR